MSEWKKVKLGEITQIIDGDRGKNYPKDRDFQNNGYCLFLNTGNVTQNGFTFDSNQFINKEKDGQLRKGKLMRGDLVYTTRGTVGNVAYYSESIPYDNIRINSGMVILRVDRNTNPTFLYQLLKSRTYRTYFKSFCTGSAQPQLPIKNLSQIIIDIPDLLTQDNMATILSRYDSLIENYQKQIKLLEEAAQRLYKEWFVDLHFPGHENTKIADGVPEGWEKKRIGDVVEYFDKQRKPLSSMQRMSMDKVYPYYGAATLMDYVDNYLFDGIYLLLGEDGTVITPDNYPVLQYVWGKFWVNNHAHVLRGKDSISTEFLYAMFKEMPIADVVTGAAQPKISQGRLSEKKVLIPPIQLILKWSDITKAYFDSYRNLSDKIRLLTEARDRLLPKLMSGEIVIANK